MQLVWSPSLRAEYFLCYGYTCRPLLRFPTIMFWAGCQQISYNRSSCIIMLDIQKTTLTNWLVFFKASYLYEKLIILARHETILVIFSQIDLVRCIFEWENLILSITYTIFDKAWLAITFWNSCIREWYECIDFIHLWLYNATYFRIYDFWIISF